MSATLVIIAITCVVSFVAFRNEKLIHDLILWPPAISRDKQYYRLLSYGFIHADGSHLLFNMITLFFFGRLIEQFVSDYIGTLGFAAFYLSAIVVSILPTYLKNVGIAIAVWCLRPFRRVVAFVLRSRATSGFFHPCRRSIRGVSSVRSKGSKGTTTNHMPISGAAYGVLFLLAMEPRLVGVFLDQLFMRV